MKIGIVIPLKSKSIAKNWAVTTDNLKATINSVIAQTKDDYQAVVVGHDKPEFINTIKRTDKCEFQYLKEIEPPRIGRIEAENQISYEKDRCSKILKGVIYLKSKYPDITHWFALDADDLLHDEFIEELQKYEEKPAIILNHGYVLFKSTGIVNVEDEFSAYCGSSAVLADSLFELPSRVFEDSFKKIPFGAISHVTMKEALAKQGGEIVVPNQRLVMYVRDNGENISNDAYYDTLIKRLKKGIKMLLKARNLDSETKAHFGLYEP